MCVVLSEGDGKWGFVYKDIRAIRRGSRIHFLFIEEFCDDGVNIFVVEIALN